MIPRYRDPRITSIWDRQTQIMIWRDVEMAWLSQLAPEAADALVDDGSVDYPDEAIVADYERRTRHEFTAFLDAWMAGWDEGHEEARRWVHYGLTSSDVIDTATAIQLCETQVRLFELADGVRRAVEAAIYKLDEAQQVGRTHGQWAQPRRAAQPLIVLVGMFNRQLARVGQAGGDLGQSDLSGPTGERLHLDPAMVRRALEACSLVRAASSTQILPRDGWVHWAHTVAGLVTVCEAIADHYWFLAQDGIDEVTVGLPAPSSAMPHKRNPALAENVRGLARMARHYASMLDESIVQRGDRDLAHSSVERVALPDLCHLAATALTRTAEIARTYEYDLSVVRANCAVATVAGARSHEEVMENVRQGMSRAAAMEKENPHE